MAIEILTVETCKKRYSVEFNATGGGCQLLMKTPLPQSQDTSKQSIRCGWIRRTMAKPRPTKSYVEEWKSLWQPDLDAIAYNTATCDPTRVEPKVLQWAKQNCCDKPHFIKIVNKNAVPDRPGLKPQTASYCQMNFIDGHFGLFSYESQCMPFSIDLESRMHTRFDQLRSSYCQMTVPTPFLKQHFRKLERVVKLESEAGKTWKVSFGAPRVDSYWQQGCFRFSSDNNLKAGDVLVFVLVGNSHFHFTRFDECGNMLTSSHTDTDTVTVKREDCTGCSPQGHEESDPPCWKRARLCNAQENLKKHTLERVEITFMHD